MTDKINLSDSVYNLQEGVSGYLNRAPLLCGSYSVIRHTSSVFRVEDLFNKVLYDSNAFNKSIKSRKKEVLNYGYTDSNIRKDIKRGVLKS